MEHFTGTEFSLENTCVSFGSFDGMHLGHRAVVAQMLRHPECRSVVLSFEAPADEKVIYDEEEKKLLLKEMGVDTLISYPAAAARALTAEDFVRQVLAEKLGAKIVVVGEGFTFGSDGGDVALLQKLAPVYGYAVVVCGTVSLDGEEVSAAAIRAAFDAMDFAKATALMGHTYIMYGKVMHGKAEGRTVGMPTANLGVPANKLFPPHGVYATLSDFDGTKHRGLTNIGLRPSADTIPKATIETFILNFSGDLYDKYILLEVHKYIRGVQKFKDLAAVKEQVNKDIAQVHEYLEQIGQ